MTICINKKANNGSNNLKFFKFRFGGVAQVLECLPSKFKTLSSNLSSYSSVVVHPIPSIHHPHQSLPTYWSQEFQCLVSNHHNHLGCCFKKCVNLLNFWRLYITSKIKITPFQQLKNCPLKYAENRNLMLPWN
jgi:hypothetical protein